MGLFIMYFICIFDILPIIAFHRHKDEVFLDKKWFLFLPMIICAFFGYAFFKEYINYPGTFGFYSALVVFIISAYSSIVSFIMLIHNHYKH